MVLRNGQVLTQAVVREQCIPMRFVISYLVAGCTFMICADVCETLFILELLLTSRTCQGVTRLGFVEHLWGWVL